MHLFYKLLSVIFMKTKILNL